MIQLVPMLESEFDSYVEKTAPAYAAENVKAGYWPEEGALERSRKVFEDLLPQGVKTENNYLFRIQLTENGEKIGMIWMKHEAPRRHGFIFDFMLDEIERGKGYGKQAMLALEEIARKMGLATLGLHVFTHNIPALRLYEKLGYEATSQNMQKKLNPF